MTGSIATRLEKLERGRQDHSVAAEAFRVVLRCKASPDADLMLWRQAFADWQTHFHGPNPRDWSPLAAIWAPDGAAVEAEVPDPDFTATIPHFSDEALAEAIETFKVWAGAQLATQSAELDQSITTALEAMPASELQNLISETSER